ncbi:uncharacterized protein LOC111626178 [Centruroides sculpturatus]|uniref:uncharacterized protein LOC111626178 n=1 Tax=Centruroides sculpturatus TaxID=218467 RepID=UPI000C6C896D|nr:uncharacterized protein LOC111626178 [Centruroides sculpturatus]
MDCNNLKRGKIDFLRGPRDVFVRDQSTQCTSTRKTCDEGMNRRMLSWVKRESYHPALPKFNSYCMDTMRGKLADEHCRASTHLDKTDFIPFNKWKPMPEIKTDTWKRENRKYGAEKFVKTSENER